MFRIATAQVWVHDQDEALDFYTKKLGMEVRSDVTVPVMDAETSEQVKSLMAKGFAGTVFLTTDDVHADYEELKGRGVEFTEEPEERPYGIDCGFRDASGNSLRLTEPKEMS